MRFGIVPDPRYFETNGKAEMCQGCFVQRACHTHHKEFKQMGGRKGAAKIKSEDPSNKIDLCVVCHEATHNIPATVGKFSCRVCPQLHDCFYGARLLKLPDYEARSRRW